MILKYHAELAADTAGLLATSKQPVGSLNAADSRTAQLLSQLTQLLVHYEELMAERAELSTALQAASQHQSESLQTVESLAARLQNQLAQLHMHYQELMAKWAEVSTAVQADGQRQTVPRSAGLQHRAAREPSNRTSRSSRRTGRSCGPLVCTSKSPRSERICLRRSSRATSLSCFIPKMQSPRSSKAGLSSCKGTTRNLRRPAIACASLVQTPMTATGP